MQIVRRIYGPFGSADLENSMRKLIVAEQISLDGVIQSPGGPEEDPSGEFRLGGWMLPYADEAIAKDLQDLFSQPFELLLGRRTYEIFAVYWPRVPVDSDSRAIADLFNSVPKHVATHRSDTLDWQNSHALEGDLADVIRALKQQGGAKPIDAWQRRHGAPTACSRVSGRAAAYDLS